MSNIIENTPRDKCTGCSACVSICHNSAIELIQDEKGFIYPIIHNDKCSNCGMCSSVCPMNNDVFSNDFQQAYAIKHHILGVRENSSSGGAFTLISDEILRRGGAVYGAVYSDGMIVEHCRATDVIGRNRMRDSKYVQSQLGNAFLKIKNDLHSGMWVLFSGTPCQVAGLKSFLNNADTSKLITCDIFCHSVPSPGVFKDHLSLNEKIKHSKVINYTSRDKSFGWKRQDCIYYEDGRKDSSSFLSQMYYVLYNKNIINRPSCTTCKYSTIKRVGDFSIGDFWGCDKSFKDNMGVSALLVNSVKGKNLFECVKCDCNVREVPVEDIFIKNHQKPIIANEQTEMFWNDYITKGYLYCIKKYCNYNLWGRIRFLMIKVYRTIKTRSII